MYKYSSSFGFKLLFDVIDCIFCHRESYEKYHIILAMSNLQVYCSSLREEYEQMQGTYKHVLYFSEC
jgi:hypothetical protein